MRWLVRTPALCCLAMGSKGVVSSLRIGIDQILLQIQPILHEFQYKILHRLVENIFVKRYLST
jgi:hypothetical protein